MQTFYEWTDRKEGLVPFSLMDKGRTKTKREDRRSRERDVGDDETDLESYTR